jgi:tetratricopeptide (TPR) repeat protein
MSLLGASRDGYSGDLKVAKKKGLTKDAGPYPKGGTFGQLFEWHLVRGTRAHLGATKSAPWKFSEFALLVHDVEKVPERLQEKLLKNATTNLRNWRSGVIPSADDELRVQRIFRELFDNNPELRRWKKDLIEALRLGREAKQARIISGKSAAGAPIPQPTIHFVGRSWELHKLTHKMTAGSFVLVQGGPGIGKTELTKALAHGDESVRRFGERRFFVQLEACPTAEAMKNATIQALGCDRQRGFEFALSTLGSKPSLLILDSLETSWEPVAERSATLAVLQALSLVPDLTIVASFRGFEAVGGVRWTEQRLIGLDPESAKNLFISVAGPLMMGDRRLNEFIHALDGNPLAIELVARRAHGRKDLSSLWKEWLRCGVDLAQHPDFEPNRLTSLSASIALSLRSRRMAKADRLFALLGALPTGLSSADVIKLIGAEKAFEAQECLYRGGLAYEFLDRICLLPPIREYALRHTKLDGAEAFALVTHFLSIAKELLSTLRSRDHEVARQRARIEFKNIESIFRIAMQHKLYSEAHSGLHDMALLSEACGERTSIFGELVNFFRFADHKYAEAEANLRLGDAASAWPDSHVAKSAYERARQCFLLLSDDRGAALSTEGLGFACYTIGEIFQAKAAFEEAAIVFSRNGDTELEVSCLFALAGMELAGREFEVARAHLTALAEKCSQLSLFVSEAACLCALASLDIEQGDTVAALESFRTALNKAKLGNSKEQEAAALNGLSYLSLLADDLIQFEVLKTDAMRKYGEIGDVDNARRCSVDLVALGCLKISIDTFEDGEHFDS